MRKEIGKKSWMYNLLVDSVADLLVHRVADLFVDGRALLFVLLHVLGLTLLLLHSVTHLKRAILVLNFSKNTD